MHLRTLGYTLAAIVTTSACGNGSDVRADTRPVPPTVSCADAPELRERAAADRRQSDEQTSDQQRVTLGNRANFFASLAIAADLSCRVMSPDADAALRRALDAARQAEAASSFYEKAGLWSDASFIATEAASILLRQLPAEPSK